MDADVIVVGAGLAGLVATIELTAAGRRVLLVDQENAASIGGQAHWSLGGLFLVDTPEQRALGIRDSREIAWQDWLTNASFDAGDHWPRRWAQAYVEFAAGEERAWLASLGHRVRPAVRWAKRGGPAAGGGPGNSVPRFHLIDGAGPAVLAPFLRRVEDAPPRYAFRHRVDQLTRTGGRVTGVAGTVLAPDGSPRGMAGSEQAVGSFEFTAQAVVVASGGIGGDLGAVRAAWPAHLRPAPRNLLAGVPAHVDGRLLDIAEHAGAYVTHRDRMWHYSEGVPSWEPVWAGHGVRILPGPSPIWFDARGRRLPSPLFPGADSLATLEHIVGTGHDHTWFVLTRRIADAEVVFSGSEHLGVGALDTFLDKGADVVVADTLDELAAGMTRLAPGTPITAARLRGPIEARDHALLHDHEADPQVAALFAHRAGGRVTVAEPHRILDPAAGPLLAIKLGILTRKSLGGIATDLGGHALRPDGGVLPGLYAAGEAAGFGGGGMHGRRALEGTFLGGCLFSARVTGRSTAADLA